MNFIKELLSRIFNQEDEDPILDDRLEFRLNKQEKILIKKYCKLRDTDCSKLFRRLAMQEIDSFIKSNPGN